jgi:cobalamin biosynthesis Mg chelatase CobN
MRKMAKLTTLLLILLYSSSSMALPEPAHVLFIATDHVSSAKLRNLKAMATDITLDYKYLRDLPKDTPLSDIVGQADLVVFDSVNGNEAKRRFAHFAPQVAALSAQTRFIAIRWPQGESLRAGLSADQAQRLHDYYWHGGQENFRRLLAYIARDVFALGGAEVQAPIQYPELGIYHPDYSGRIFATLDEYLDWQATRGLVRSKAVIGISLHRETLSSDLTQIADAMIRQIELRDEIPLAFYFSSGKETPDYIDWLQHNGKPIIEVLINTRVIHWAEKRRAEFERLGVPVIQTLNYPGTEDEWRQDAGGIPANLIPFYFTLSEIAGVSDPITVGVDADDGMGVSPVEAQIKLLVAKAVRLANLRRLSNREKRVAILYYNYPPGERNASASFLNIPRSLETIFAALRAKGYQADELKEQGFIDAVAEMQRPLYREVSPAKLVEQGLAEAMPVRRYRTWFDSLPSTVQAPIINSWGQPEDHFMVAKLDGELQFVIPMLRSGNLRVLPQPPRGNKNEREKSIYHSKSVAVNHYYMAVYLHLRQEFGADALVHLGTHGSHEWLPGKERGLWAFDPGNLTAGDIPVVYPYIVDDVGEALQAKRRGRAVTISHSTPPFAPSGLYRELSEVHELMHQYNELDQGLVRERTQQQLLKLTESLSLLKDMGWDKDKANARFDDFIAELHDYLHELGTENQPLGLHTWGQVPENRLLITTLLQILGPEFAAALREHGTQPSHDPNHSHASPHDGIVVPIQGGYVELKLHDDKGDLELWIAKDAEFKTPIDLPLSASPTVTFVDKDGKQLQLAVRNKHQNEDEDGKPNNRNGKTNYFIFPGNTGIDASWLKGKAFRAKVIVAFEQDGIQRTTKAFILSPHTHAENGVDLESLPGFHLIQHYVIEAQDFNDNIAKPLIPFLEKARDIHKRIVGNREMSNLIAALAGQYVSSSTGGDPIRNDESLPTGRNLYGFDPSRVPTKAAWEAGRTLVETMIQDHQKRHGRYPEKMAFSLWSIETMRHYGVLESQALYAMGVRPVWAKSGRVTGTEIIPYAELGRARVDVVLSATGLYRDAFPGVMKLIAEGIDKVARLKEENNFVYRHAQRLKAELEAQGIADADYLSTARIFSNASGTYGTGLAAGTLASDTWDNDSRLAEMYLDRMGHIFGADESRWGEKLADVNLYARNLSGTDIALFSRSSNVYGLLTSDDPFQYLGGISLAVRHLDGRSPEMYISNLRNPKQSKTEALGRFLSKELRTRYLHPRWITEMQQEGYAGTLSILDTVNNFWGWQVVDPQNVRDDQWQAFYEVYVQDKYELNMREWFESNNAEALAQVIERMLEAVRKDYWQANEAIVRELVKTYRELVAHHDIITQNRVLPEYVETLASGYGLEPPSIKPVPESTPPAVQQTVQGQRLEQVKVEKADNWQWLLWLLLFVTALGFMRQLVVIKA